MQEKTYNKYKLVVDEWFVNGFNGTKAYQKFYPECEYESADASFRKILENTRIDDYIREKENNAKNLLKTSHEVLLKELENWAYSDITETILLTPEQVKELPSEVRRLITKFKTVTKNYTLNDEQMNETTVELWFVSKEKAMEMIHKHTGFYAEDNFQKTAVMTPEERAKRINELSKKL